MANHLNSAIQLLRSINSASTAKKSDLSDFEIAASHWLLNMTFRLPEMAKTDRLIGLRLIWRALKRTRQNCVFPFDQNSTIAVLGATPRNKELIVEYIKRSSKKSIGFFIAKDYATFYPGASLAEKLNWLFFSLHIAFQCCFRSDRANRALMIFSAVEVAWVAYFVKEKNISYLYDFIPYEADGNAISLAMKKAGVGLTKIPSSGPLGTHNRWMIADEVILSSAYHYEELPFLKDTLRVKTQTLWPPEKAFTYLSTYKDRPVPPPKTIGYLSHAEWIRREEGHGHNGIDVQGTEQEMWRDLIRYIKNREGYKLIIFPHPHERKPELKERMEKYYHDLFHEINYEIIDEKWKTSQAFHKVDVAVVSYSTIIYERLFCGYKLLIATNKIDEFPLKGSPLHSICFKDYASMERLLDKAEKQTNEEFYTENKLVGYRYFDHPGLEEMCN
jgi:hypothetical protein